MKMMTLCRPRHVLRLSSYCSLSSVFSAQTIVSGAHWTQQIERDVRTVNVLLAHIKHSGRSFSSTKRKCNEQYSEEELDLVREALRSGKSRNEVYEIVKSHGKRSSFDVNYMVAVATKFQSRKYARESATSKPLFPQRPWSEDDLIMLHRRLGEGIPVAQLSAELQRSVNSIREMTHDIRTWAGAKRPEKRPWTDDDILDLRQFVADGATVSKCAAKLGRSRGAVFRKKALLGLTPKIRRPGWIAEEDKALETLYAQGLTDEEISKRLRTQRSQQGVKKRRLLLALKRVRPAQGGRYALWSAADDDQLRQCQQMKNEDIAPLLSVPRSPSAIANRLARLKVRPRHVRPWTETESQQLLDLRQQGLSDREIGERLGRTRSAISMQRMRLKHTVERSET